MIHRGPGKPLALLHRRRGTNLGFTKSGSVAASSVDMGLLAHEIHVLRARSRYECIGNVWRQQPAPRIAGKTVQKTRKELSETKY